MFDSSDTKGENTANSQHAFDCARGGAANVDITGVVATRSVGGGRFKV
jgi:hypothetical protein